MRRAIRDAMPGLAHWFGLKPADVDAMTDGEVNVFLNALQTISEQMRAQNAG